MEILIIIAGCVSLLMVILVVRFLVVVPTELQNIRSALRRIAMIIDKPDDD